MKSATERMREFVKYHITGDGECNNVVLRGYADKHGLDLQHRYELAFFFSITYSVVSASVLFENQRDVFRDINSWVERNKPLLVFQSDRKYVKMRDSFNKLLEFFENRAKSVEWFLEKTSRNGKIILSKAIPEIEGWAMFGRFSAFLLLETFVNLTDFPIENTTIEWKRGNTATSGLLNLFCMDDAANLFDKRGMLRVPDETMDKMLRQTMKAIGEAGGSTNVTEIETSLCAYRKFYKASRYNGYYLDRMLEEIVKMRTDFPEITKEYLEIRAEKFPHKYLGECGGWHGVRPMMKKVYITTGAVT